MIKLFSWILCSCLIISQASIGAPLSADKVIAFSGGPAWYQAGNTQTIQLQPNFTNTYAATIPQQVLANGELFFGLQRTFARLGFGQLGLAIAGSSDARLQGYIWETADPLFDNFSYHYKISHAHLALKTKWLFNHWSPSVLPYFSASLGVAQNKAHHFYMTPLIFEALPTPNFQNHQETALSYTLGIGVHKTVNSQIQLGVGYEFGDWGHSSLNRAPGQTLNHGLSLNHLYTQQLQFTVNYLFSERS